MTLGVLEDYYLLNALNGREQHGPHTNSLKDKFHDWLTVTNSSKHSHYDRVDHNGRVH